MSPSVVPLFGSTPISGTGMNGAVAGLNHLEIHWGAWDGGGDPGGDAGGGPDDGGGGICPGGGAWVGVVSGGSAQHAAADSTASSSQRAGTIIRATAQRRPTTDPYLPP